MKHLVVVFFLLISFSNCTSNVEKPENLLDEKDMVNILIDISIHQQSSFLSQINNQKMDFAKIDAQILQNHQTNAKDFEESYRYYYLHPEMYNDILIEVRDKLEEKLPEKEREKRVEERKNKAKEKKK